MCGLWLGRQTAQHGLRLWSRPVYAPYGPPSPSEQRSPKVVLVGQVLGDVAAGLDLRDADRAYLVERLEEGRDLALVLSFDDRNQMMLAGDDTFREKRYVVSGRTLWLHVIRESFGHPLVARGALLGVVPVVNEETSHVEPPTQRMQCREY